MVNGDSLELYCGGCDKLERECRCAPYIAHFECNCGHVWHDRVGPHSNCPKCHSDYFIWRNYKESVPLQCKVCNKTWSVV